MTTTNTIAAHATPAPASGQFGTPNQPGRIYLSGPMSGLPEHNYPAFNAAAARLRAQGHDVVNPAELNPDASTDWHACLRRDIAALTTCNTLALMPGWEHSQGAHLELDVAHRLGLHITTVQALSEAAEAAHRQRAAEIERQRAAADERAHRIASMAAEELVRCEGAHTNAPDEFALSPCQIDEHTRECIDHLIYSGLAITFEREDGTLLVQLGDFTLEGLAE